MDNIILQKTWVQGCPVIVDNLLGTAFTGEAQAHTFVVSGVDAAQEPVAITGTITGKFLAANNVTVPLTGSLVNGAASVTLTDECYDVPGRYILSIYATNGETTQCLYCAVGNVFRTDSQTIAYPSTDLPNITTLMAQLEEILDGWPADYSQLQSDVSNLKSAFDTVQTWTWAFDNLMLDNSGNTSPSNYHLLSHPLYHIPAGSTVTIDSGFGCTPVVYNSDGTFNKFGTKRNGPYTISFNSANYIRLYIVTNPTGSLISPADVNDKVHASWDLEKFYEKNATQAELDSDVATLNSKIDTNLGLLAKGVSARGQLAFNINLTDQTVEIPADRLLFDGRYYQASSATLNYSTLGYPAVFFNTNTHAYEIHPIDSSLTDNTISPYCRFIAYINKTNPWQSSSALKYTVNGKTEFAELEYPIAGKNAIFENWCYPKSFSYNGTMNNLYVGIVQMNNGKQGVLQYNKQTHTISRHVFNDFSALDSHNAMAVVVMPNRHIMVIGTGHMANSNLVCYISKNQEDISEFGPRTLIPAPTSESGTYRFTYAQIFFVNGAYHLFTRLSLVSGSNYTDSWGHSVGTITTAEDGSESVSWSAFVPFIIASAGSIKYYAKGAYYSGTKIKFFCQSNYSQAYSDIRLCYLDVATGAITDDAGNTLGNENNAPVEFTNIPVVIDKGTAKLHLMDVLDGTVNAISYSRIYGSYTNGQKSFVAIYENGAWNAIELPEQGVPVYGSGSSGPGVTIVSNTEIIMAVNNGTSWTLDKYTRNEDSFVFDKTILNVPGGAKVFQPYVSANIHDAVVCAQGYPVSYYDMDIATTILDV